MSERLRRYVVYLPLRFNDGRPVPAELVGEAILELEERFGAASSDLRAAEGFWRHEGVRYRDELARVFVDVPDTPENRAFFEQLKERLKRDFKQIDIWMTTWLIDAV